MSSQSTTHIQPIYIQLISIVLWINFFTIQSAETSKYIHCYDQTGSAPTHENDLVSTATCEAVGYFVMSCNAKTEGSGPNQGALFEEPNSCSALSSTQMSRNFAYARCCNLTCTDCDESFDTYQSSPSKPNDNDRTTANCDDEELIGCNVKSLSDSAGQRFDGSFSGNASFIYDNSKRWNTNNTCTAQNGVNGEGVLAEAICYDKDSINDGYKLKCFTIWAAQATSDTSTVSCTGPVTKQFMTSCNVYSSTAMIKAYFIENDECKVKTSTSSTTYATANAICCTMTKTVLDPTRDRPTTTFIFTQESTQNVQQDPGINAENNLMDSIPFFVIVLVLSCCCMCIIVCIGKCITREKKAIYKIGSVHTPVCSTSNIMKDVVNKKESEVLQMCKVASSSSNIHNEVDDEGTAAMRNDEQSGNTPGSNILNDEFIIDGDDDILTTRCNNGNGGNNDNNEVITESDEGTGDVQLDIDDSMFEGNEQITSEGGMDAN